MTDSYISDRAKELKPSGIRKFFDLVANTSGVISLGIGEPDYVTPWKICGSAINSIQQGYTMYTSNAGMPELRQAVCDDLNRRFGLKYKSENCMITVGASEALDMAARAILNPTDEVIVPEPCYVAYPAVVELAGAKVVSVPTYEKNNFELHAEDIESKITSKTKAILFGYPCNPTGAIMSRERLLEIAELAKKHDLIVMADEIYERLTYGTEHVCFASLPGMQERTILLGGFSKAYAMTGWRIGYALAPKDILDAMLKIHQHVIMCASTASQCAALTALKECQDASKAMIDDYNRRRQLIVGGLRRIGFSVFEPKGAFYCFPNITSTGLSSEEFAEQLLKQEKVAVIPGTAFGDSGEGYVRCCYATAIDDIREALTRIQRFVESLKK